MTTTIRVRQFLKELEAAYPPPENCHHGLAFAHHVDEEKLALHLNYDGRFTTLFVGELDLDRPVEELMVAVKTCLQATGGLPRPS